ncbi:hypothetical protein [Chondromyces apiculatus]|uniref:Uncharacterized protein n=1 Tax=Chondromyces apiculatus DSM 436 TaxID=1192034 RepID=A0A017SZ04_9BACT|nr:hypothetical protein [Chondromyces apiculatus]EYF02219.1 Hypothetical protein CAP_7291 [Chondromyces apiculatus DSM 436]
MRVVRAGVQDAAARYSFTEIVNMGVYVNYEAGNHRDWGWTDPSYLHDIVLTPLALRMGRWAIAGTIVHEIAHLNGAPGGNDHAAEVPRR